MNLKPFILRTKYWLNDFIKGGIMFRCYKDAYGITMNKISEDEICKKREKDLYNILHYACDNIEYYKMKNIYSKNLSDFPVVNKNIYTENYDLFCAPIEKIPGQEGNLHIQSTSGSTGIPFSVPQDTLCRLKRIAIIKAENEKINFHSFEPMMHLRYLKSHGSNIDFKHSKDLNIWYVDNSNLSEEKILKIIDTINKNRIKVVRGYMTSLDFITHYMVNNNIKFNHKVIFISVGELLQENLRIRICQDLHCYIISQYGNEENGIFGQSEINGCGNIINLNGAGCIVEILKMDKDEPADKGEIGRIVVTDLTNYAFPMIRYEIGDVAAPCDYYKNGDIKKISNLLGRKSDIIYDTKGTPVDLINRIPMVLYNSQVINQHQFIQKDKNKYLLKLCVKKEIDKILENEIIDEFINILGSDAILSIEYVNSLPILSSGKRKVIVNEWKKFS